MNASGWTTGNGVSVFGRKVSGEWFIRHESSDGRWHEAMFVNYWSLLWAVIKMRFI